jgi:sugar transferase (PEP-CTERM/EpsH1 system associated)
MSDRKLKILFLAHRVPYPPNKGEKIRTFNQIKHLHEKGHSVFICAPIDEPADHENLKILTKKYCTQAQGAKKAGLLRLIKGLLKNQPLSVANFYSNALQLQTDAIISEQDVDTIICSSSSMAEYVLKSASLNHPEKPQPKLIMDFMDLDSDKWLQYQKLKPFPMKFIYKREAKLLFQYEQKIHRRFDACLFISQAEVDLFQKRDKNLGKVSVVANGLDTNYFKPNLAKKSTAGPILLFTGVMDYFPNIDAVEWFVKNAWPDIKNRWTDAQFIIAGMNPTPKIIALEKNEGIIVTGFVEDIREYYNQADFFVAPFQIARGVQNKVLQAFACGLPVIGTSMAFEGISCHDKKDMLVANTPKEYSDSLQHLIEDKELKAHLSRSALDLVTNHYSWSGCLKNLDEVLNT